MFVNSLISYSRGTVPLLCSSSVVHMRCYLIKGYNLVSSDYTSGLREILMCFGGGRGRIFKRFSEVEILEIRTRFYNSGLHICLFQL